MIKRYNHQITGVGEHREMDLNQWDKVLVKIAEISEVAEKMGKLGDF